MQVVPSKHSKLYLCFRMSDTLVYIKDLSVSGSDCLYPQWHTVLKRQNSKHYHRRSTSYEVGVGIDHFKQMRCQLVHVGNRSDTECHDTPLPCKRSHVAVNSHVDVLPYHQCTLGIRRVFLRRRQLFTLQNTHRLWLKNQVQLICNVKEENRKTFCTY